MKVNSDIQIVQGFYGWHVWSVNRKVYTLPVKKQNKTKQLCFLLFGCVLSFVFMHTCFVGVEILAPQMANWTKKKKNKVINYFFFLLVELLFVSLAFTPPLMIRGSRELKEGDAEMR